VTALERLRRTGIRRRRAGKGFVFRTVAGRPLKRSDVERIRSLAIPPSWRDVVVSPSPQAKLQAMGRDKAGRWQYRYHPVFRQRQDARKYGKLVDFAAALPRMRKRVAADLRQPGLGQDRVIACAIRVLSTCFMRPGSDEYARAHRHFGLTTLLNKHTTVKGDLVTFDFPGKSGQPQHRQLRDRTVASVVRRMLVVPGRELFKFLDDDGTVVDVKRDHLNQYIHAVMGPDFTAKDFRTWAGTLICACALARAVEEPDPLEASPKRARKKRVVEAVKEAAAELGNTPAVARNSYIEPSVLSQFEKGEVVEKYFENVKELVEHKEPTLHRSEKALKELLETAAD
jgi:DNA topoisomerase-1